MNTEKLKYFMDMFSKLYDEGLWEEFLDFHNLMELYEERNMSLTQKMFIEEAYEKVRSGEVV